MLRDDFQKLMNIRDFYPIWLFQPQKTDYLGRRNPELFRNYNFVSLSDFNNGLLHNLLFHVSLNPVNKSNLDEFFNEYWLYEFSVPETAIYRDILEGYGICGVVPFIYKQNLVTVYEPTTVVTEDKFYKRPVVEFTPHFVRDNTAISLQTFQACTVDHVDGEVMKLIPESVIDDNYARQEPAIQTEPIYYPVPTEIQISNITSL